MSIGPDLPVRRIAPAAGCSLPARGSIVFDKYVRT
jgi:hypothetical protein